MSSASCPAPQSIDSLYTQHHGWLQGLLRKRLGSLPDAADLAHDIFVRLLQKPRYFDSAEGTRSWLSVVAHGMCVDLWRRREVERQWLASLAQHEQRVVLSAEENAIILETLWQIDALLCSLPQNVRSAFIMAQLQGATYQQIAGVLGVSERMVKKYMASAMLHCVLLVSDTAAATTGGRSG